jgi:hypothetical protein
VILRPCILASTVWRNILGDPKCGWGNIMGIAHCDANAAL